MSEVTLHWDKFIEKYRPVTNHIDDNASLDGCMFETYGEELVFVRNANINHIWTWIECDDEDDAGEDASIFILGNGMHKIGRAHV